jgi:hypothetical protein
VPLDGCNVVTSLNKRLKVLSNRQSRRLQASNAKTMANATLVGTREPVCSVPDVPGICDDHIANDGYQKICLEGPGRTNGESCDVDRQCGVSPLRCESDSKVLLLCAIHLVDKPLDMPRE